MRRLVVTSGSRGLEDVPACQQVCCSRKSSTRLLIFKTSYGAVQCTCVKARAVQPKYDTSEVMPVQHSSETVAQHRPAVETQVFQVWLPPAAAALQWKPFCAGDCKAHASKKRSDCALRVESLSSVVYLVAA